MILAFLIVVAIMFAIWYVIEKNTSPNTDDANYVKIKPKDEDKGTDNNG